MEDDKQNVCREDSPFVRTAARLVATSLHTVNDASPQLLRILDFPFNKLLGTEEVTGILQDNFKEVPSSPPSLFCPQLRP